MLCRLTVFMRGYRFPLGRCRHFHLTDEVEHDPHMLDSLARGFVRIMADDSFDKIIHNFRSQFTDADILSHNGSKLFKIG